MTIFLLFLMIAVMLAIDIARRSNQPQKVSDARPARENSTPLFGQRFFHPAHSWTVVDTAEQVTVGIDDFAQSVLGQLTGARLPELGKTCKQGEVIAVLRRGDKELPQVAPLSGTIVDVNPKLARNPRLVNTSPLDKGWIVKIAPWNLRLEVANLMRSGSAERWQKAVRDQFIQWFSGSHDLVLQDGGKIADNVCDDLSKEEWKQLVEEFFPIASNDRITKQTMD
jgi:glycine cleavage system H protein